MADPIPMPEPELVEAEMAAYYRGAYIDGAEAKERLKAFAAAVAAQARAEEREACARLCDEQHDRARTGPGAHRADCCARAIRARGESNG